MYRKIIYISFNLFEDMDLMVKICLLMCISFASFLLHYKTKPFLFKEMNSLEFYSTLSASLILFSGSLYITNANEIVNTFSFILMIIFNIYFGCIWIKSIIIANFQLIERFLPIKRKIAFSLYLVNLIEGYLKRKIKFKRRRESAIKTNFVDQKNFIF